MELFGWRRRFGGFIIGCGLREQTGPAVVGAAIGAGLEALAQKRKKELLQAQQVTKFFSFITNVEVCERAKGAVHRSGESDFSSSQQSNSSDSLASISTDKVCRVLDQKGRVRQ